MEDNNKKPDSLSNEEREERKKQQQSDPQLTELKGFIDPDEKLEPDLEEGNPKAAKDKDSKKSS